MILQGKAGYVDKRGRVVWQGEDDNAVPRPWRQQRQKCQLALHWVRLATQYEVDRLLDGDGSNVSKEVIDEGGESLAILGFAPSYFIFRDNHEVKICR